MFKSLQQRTLPTPLMIRLIKANQQAGRTITVVDNVAPASVQGCVALEPDNIMHKMTIGYQRWYVSDISSLINQGSLSLKVTK